MKELPILGVTFQENCKCSEHVRAKLIKANVSCCIKIFMEGRFQSM